MAAHGPQQYNLDINQLGTSQFPRFSITQRAPYRDGLVEDIILNEKHPEYDKVTGGNVGMAKIRFIPDDRGVPSEQLSWVMPIDTFIREYPLKNEMVMVFYSIGRMFYTRRININNKITENSWPGLRDQFGPNKSSRTNVQAMNLAAQGGPVYKPWDAKNSIELGDEFVENVLVKMARPNEGDSIIQSRFGSIVRLGSSLFSNPTTRRPQPNLLLTVGLGTKKVVSTEKFSAFSLSYEDINTDKNCIWMVTDEKIILDPATKGTEAHLRSSETSDVTKYTGAQIFINSDRIILNSKVNEISLFSKKEINLSSVESITLDSAKSVFISSEKDIEISTPTDIVLNARSVVINSPNDISQGTSGNYVISAKKIFIGSGGDESQPLVLGGELARWLQKLMDAFIIEIPKSIVTLNPAPFTEAITRLRLELGLPASPQSAIFNSTSNFTSKTN